MNRLYIAHGYRSSSTPISRAPPASAIAAAPATQASVKTTRGRNRSVDTSATPLMNCG